jgi:leader peptidase (prepilin peptidase)/N-methyltransferase
MTTLAAAHAHPQRRPIEARSRVVFAGYVATAIVALAAPEGARLAWLAMAGLVLVLLAATDLRTRLVPNALLYPAVLGSLLVAAAFGGDAFGTSVLGTAVGFVAFYVFALVSRGALGMGDVKLAAYVGSLLGVGALVVALAAGMLVASALALALLVLRRASRKDTLPLAPFLVLPALLILAAGGGVV